MNNGGQLLAPDGKTPLREYESYSGGGAGFGGQLAQWLPASQNADAALLPQFERGNARADDLVRNNGYAANGVQLHQDHIVGSFFRLSYRPNWQRPGISEDDSRAMADDVEAAWREYAEDHNCYFLGKFGGKIAFGGRFGGMSMTVYVPRCLFEVCFK